MAGGPRLRFGRVVKVIEGLQYHGSEWNENKLIVYLKKNNHVIMVTLANIVITKYQLNTYLYVIMVFSLAFKLEYNLFGDTINNFVNMERSIK